MKKALYPIILSAIHLLYGCNSNLLSDDSNSPVKDIEATQLSTERLINYPTDSLLKPKGILSFGDYIIIRNDRGRKHFTIFNTQTETTSFALERGEGPNESIMTQEMFEGQDNQSFYSHDIAKKEIFETSLIDFSTKPLSVNTGKLQSFYRLKDNRFVGSSISGNPRFVIADSTAKIITGNGVFNKNEEHTEIDATQWAYLYSGYSTINPIKKKAAIFSIFAGHFDIFSFEKDQINNVITKHYEGPIAQKTKHSQPAFSTNSKMHFVSVTSTKNHIYALYSGISFLEMMSKGKGTKGMHTNKLLVYDWDGKLIKYLELDNEIFALSYNEKHDIFYGISELDEPVLYSFKINPPLLASNTL